MSSRGEGAGRTNRGVYQAFVGGVAAVAALLLLVTQLVGDDDGGAVTPEGSGDVVRLEPISYVPPDPFTQPLTSSPTPTPTPTPPTVVDVDVALPEDDRLPVPAASAGAVGSITPDTAGLYGGNLRYSRCNRLKLATFLEAEPAKARAWVGALNADPSLSWSGGSRLRVADIRTYIFELTPVVLRTDTWVTNHGYSNGRATPVQAVLQAGTSVLVDGYGIPRVKCYCGNPLLPPRRDRTPVYEGDRWDGFDPTKVVVIVPPPRIITIFVLYDLDTNGLMNRPPGTEGEADEPGSGTTSPTGPTATGPTGTGPTFSVPPDVELGTGDVQVTLLWDGGADLDLHVIDPQGNEIYFFQPTSPTGGELDVDDRAGCGTSEGAHAENVFWPEGGAPSGTYEVFVVNYSGCGGRTDFAITITVGGDVVQTVSGTLASSATSETISFDA